TISLHKHVQSEPYSFHRFVFWYLELGFIISLGHAVYAFRLTIFVFKESWTLSLCLCLVAITTLYHSEGYFFCAVRTFRKRVPTFPKVKSNFGFLLFFFFSS
uniref:Uncharacterized protein n=1 Tax=Gasterosteus aculeatus TaxID=69293 RepID=G3NBN7_GASAC